MNLLFVDEKKDSEFMQIGARIFQSLFHHQTQTYGLYDSNIIDEKEIDHLMAWCDFAITFSPKLTQDLCHMQVYQIKTITLKPIESDKIDRHQMIQFLLDDLQLKELRTIETK